MEFYTVKAYDCNSLFKVIKAPVRLSDTFASKTEAPPVEHNQRLRQSICRSRSAVRDYILANNWDYFVTLTFDGSKINRYDFECVLSKVRPFLHELARNNKSFKYVLVPERHKDGAIHFHGVMTGIDVCDLPPWAPKDARDNGYQMWPLWSKKFGFTTVGRIINKVAVGFYVSKYITKSLADECLQKHQQTYFHSRGLEKPFTLGYAYEENPFLDASLHKRSQYCSVGYIKSEYDVICANLEELTMTKDIYLPDDDFVALVGETADTDDYDTIDAQESLFVPFPLPSPWDLADYA